MITSRRDYLIRIIAEVGQLLARALAQRRGGRSEDALQSVVLGCERLFQMEADQLFQFTPDQHAAMLTRDQDPVDGRDKLLLYAALNEEAGTLYASLGQATMARASFSNALRFTLRGRATGPQEALPGYTPSVERLRTLLADSPLDADIQDLLAPAEPPPL